MDNREQRFRQELQKNQVEAEDRWKRESARGPVGDPVTLPIPSADGGRSDCRNVLGVVKEPNEEDLDTCCCEGLNPTRPMLKQPGQCLLLRNVHFARYQHGHSHFFAQSCNGAIEV